MLLLSIGEHAGQGRNKSIDLGDGALLHLVKPLHIVSVALFAQTGLLRLGVLGDTILQGPAVLDRKRHVLVVELLQGHELLLGALCFAKVGNLHACRGRTERALLCGGRPARALLCGGRPARALLCGGRPARALLCGGRPARALLCLVSVSRPK